MITVKTPVCDYFLDCEFGLVSTWFQGKLHLGTFKLKENHIDSMNFYGSGLISIWGAW